MDTTGRFNHKGDVFEFQDDEEFTVSENTQIERK